MRVLSIEDYSDSVASLIGALKNSGADVSEVDTIQAATIAVRKKSFDAILADARVPDHNELQIEAGPRFIRRLSEGDLGELNHSTPAWILTSFPHEIDSAQLLDVRIFRGVLSKLSTTPSDLADILNLPGIRALSERTGLYVVEDLLVGNGPPVTDPNTEAVYLLVPAWAHGEGIWVSFEALPDDVAAQYNYGPRPFYVWARVDIEAEQPEDVRPTDFRIFSRNDSTGTLFECG